MHGKPAVKSRSSGIHDPQARIAEKLSRATEQNSLTAASECQVRIRGDGQRQSERAMRPSRWRARDREALLQPAWAVRIPLA